MIDFRFQLDLELERVKKVSMLVVGFLNEFTPSWGQTYRGALPSPASSFKRCEKKELRPTICHK